MAIGACVTVEAGGIRQVDEVRGGGGYNSSNDTRLHFGLGKSVIMTRVEVRWPSGLRQTFQNIAADAIYEIDEGLGIHKLTTLHPPTISRSVEPAPGSAKH